MTNPDDLIKRSDALNALEAYRIRLSEETGFHLKGHLAVLNNDINSIPAARSDKGEAVGWVYKGMRGKLEFTKIPPTIPNDQYIPVFTAPQQNGEAVYWYDPTEEHQCEGELVEGKQLLVRVATTKKPWGKFTAPLYLAAPQQAIPAEIIRYVGTTEDSGKADSHPNDNEPRCELLKHQFRIMSADAGQGLHPYWKWAYATGFNDAKRLLSAAPTAPIESDK
jgi:hypothetical protein